MSNNDEELSVLVDGELEGGRLHGAVERLLRDPEQAARWRRYHMVRDVVGNHLPERMEVPADFHLRVRHALEAEPTVVAPALRQRPRPSWYRPAAGLAIAASVTALAVFGVQTLVSEHGPANVGAPAMQARPVAERAPAGRNNEVEPTDARLNSYLVNHNEYAVNSAIQGALPYVRVVGYETGQ